MGSFRPESCARRRGPRATPAQVKIRACPPFPCPSSTSPPTASSSSTTCPRCATASRPAPRPPASRARCCSPTRASTCSWPARSRRCAAGSRGALHAEPPFAGLPTKDSFSDTMPFRRLKVKIKNELIRMNHPTIQPQQGRAASVRAGDARALARAGPRRRRPRAGAARHPQRVRGRRRHLRGRARLAHRQVQRLPRRVRRPPRRARGQDGGELLHRRHPLREGRAVHARARACPTCCSSRAASSATSRPPAAPRPAGAASASCSTSAAPSPPTSRRATRRRASAPTPRRSRADAGPRPRHRRAADADGAGRHARPTRPTAASTASSRCWAPPPSDFMYVKGQFVHFRDEGPEDRSDAAGADPRHRRQPAHLAGLGRRRCAAASASSRSTCPASASPARSPATTRATTTAPTTSPASRSTSSTRCTCSASPIGGNSLGGEVAWRVAAAAPARVDRLILVDATGYAFVPERIPLGFQMARMPVLNRIGEYLTPQAAWSRAACATSTATRRASPARWSTATSRC